MDIDATFDLPAGSILVITGERDTGKTSCCFELAGRWQEAGFKAAGVLSPGRFTDGQKTGFLALNPAGGDSRLFASQVQGELAGFRLGCWVFDSKAMEWGNNLLAGMGYVDLLLIDELGPLEFRFGKGWTAAIDLLRRKNFRLAVAVIRPECLDDFAALGFTGEVYEIKGRLS